MIHLANVSILSIIITGCLFASVQSTFIEVPVHHQRQDKHAAKPSFKTTSATKSPTPVPQSTLSTTAKPKPSPESTVYSAAPVVTEALINPDIVSVFSSAHGLRRKYDRVPSDFPNNRTHASRDADKSVFSLQSSLSIGDPIPKLPIQPLPPPPNITDKKEAQREEPSSTTTTTTENHAIVVSTTATPPIRGGAKKSINRMPAAGSLITAIALILANTLVNKTDLFAASFGNRSASTLSGHLSHFKSLNLNRTKSLSHGSGEEDMVASESSLSIASTASSIANWLRNAILGNKWLRKNHRLPVEYNVDRTAGQMGIHSYPDGFQQMDTNVDPNVYPQQFIQSFVPAPDGFPGPFTGNSVLLPPEALQDTGIMYWLNFIEEAAQQTQQGNGPADEEHGPDIPLHDRDRHRDRDRDRDGAGERPIKIGEKPAKTGPNSIKDELILDEGSEIDHDDVDPYERSKKTRPTQSSGGRDKLPTSIQDKTQTPGAEMIAADATAPRCDKFTSSICVDDFEYPEQAIVDEIYKRREIFELMYSGDGVNSKTSNLVDGIPKEQEEGYVYDNYDHRDRDREKDGPHASSSTMHKSESIAGYVCPSEVLYGKPKLAKNLENEWKVIVNAGEFTQTLRMEKCLKPNGQCNYIMPHYETRCAQVHSVHRLMVFEKGKGFFVESFKIPTGCNCQIIRSIPGLNQDDGQDMGSGPFDKPSISSPSLEEMLIAGPPLSFRPSQHLQSNRNRYKNTQHNTLMNALHGLHRPRPSFDHLQHQQEPQYHAVNRRPNDSSPPATYSGYSPGTSLSTLNSAINNMNQNGQLTNTLWSILMGGTADTRIPVRGNAAPASPDDHVGNVNTMPVGLISHLKQNYPQINPETFLQQLIGNQNMIHRQQQANELQNQRTQQRFKQPHNNHHVDRMNPQTGSTTTIVNPLAHLQSSGGPNQPLVQVIHVPVSSSIPNHVYKAGPGHPSHLTAYDSRSNATIVNNDTAYVAYDGYQSGEESSDSKTPAGGYLSSAKDSRYMVTPNDSTPGKRGGGNGNAATGGEEIGEGGDHEYDDEDKRTSGTDGGSSTNSAGQRDQLPNRPSHSDSRSPDSGENADQTSNNSLTKRMLSQKINFNYHPILEYIPIDGTDTVSESSASFSPRKHQAG